MPAIFLTQAHHWKAAKGTISDDGTVGVANVRSQSFEEFLNTIPESLLPLLLAWHDFSDKRQNT
ncbi:hypothetical protein KSB_88150 [Ktedonobacter robiniae]|uniref:Uncharacterized protein n=1 Tax=Ktedonobacter robiniae TaxID=2778365 RepID=A0ABQ3V7G6_9CHLR|nr:hypothetical protein KSB_88150 [Ktedonobacter robiniae]